MNVNDLDIYNLFIPPLIMYIVERILNFVNIIVNIAMLLVVAIYVVMRNVFNRSLLSEDRKVNGVYVTPVFMLK